MSTRPYLKLSAVELEQLVDRYWQDSGALQEILSELKHRSTPRAQRLERRVAERFSHATNGPQEAGSQARAGRDQEELLRRAQIAEERVRELEDALRGARQELARSRQGGAQTEHERLCAKVGLVASAPEFVVRAAQRAFRKEYHPDALMDRPVEERQRAEEVFKNVDRIFERIFSDRAAEAT